MTDQFNEDDSRWAFADLPTALLWAENRLQNGIGVALDPLGEYAQNVEQADENARNYLQALAHISKQRCGASLAIKLSALGLSFSRPHAEQHLHKILTAAKKAGLTVEIDIEGTPSVGAVCEIAQENARKGFPAVLALQAYLDRTADDLYESLQAGLKVRLVKGAYRGDTDDYNAIQLRFIDLFEQLIASGLPFDVGTHDPFLIRSMTARLGTDNRDIASFGFLKGLGEQTMEQMAASGYRVAEYVPFGSNRRAYIARRHTYLHKLEGMGLSPVP